MFSKRRVKWLLRVDASFNPLKLSHLFSACLEKKESNWPILFVLNFLLASNSRAVLG